MLGISQIKVRNIGAYRLNLMPLGGGDYRYIFSILSFFSIEFTYDKKNFFYHF